MAHEDTGWRPEGATELYDGFEVWDHGVWPNEFNHGDTEAADANEDGDEAEGTDNE